MRRSSSTLSSSRFDPARLDCLRRHEALKQKRDAYLRAREEKESNARNFKARPLPPIHAAGSEDEEICPSCCGSMDDDSSFGAFPCTSSTTASSFSSRWERSCPPFPHSPAAAAHHHQSHLLEAGNLLQRQREWSEVRMRRLQEARDMKASQEVAELRTKPDLAEARLSWKKAKAEHKEARRQALEKEKERARLEALKQQMVRARQQGLYAQRQRKHRAEENREATQQGKQAQQAGGALPGGPRGRSPRRSPPRPCGRRSVSIQTDDDTPAVQKEATTVESCQVVLAAAPLPPHSSASSLTVVARQADVAPARATPPSTAIQAYRPRPHSPTRTRAPPPPTPRQDAASPRPSPASTPRSVPPFAARRASSHGSPPLRASSPPAPPPPPPPPRVLPMFPWERQNKSWQRFLKMDLQGDSRKLCAEIDRQLSLLYDSQEPPSPQAGRGRGAPGRGRGTRGGRQGGGRLPRGGGPRGRRVLEEDLEMARLFRQTDEDDEGDGNV